MKHISIFIFIFEKRKQIIFKKVNKFPLWTAANVQRHRREIVSTRADSVQEIYIWIHPILENWNDMDSRLTKISHNLNYSLLIDSDEESEVDIRLHYLGSSFSYRSFQ